MKIVEQFLPGSHKLFSQMLRFVRRNGRRYTMTRIRYGCFLLYIRHRATIIAHFFWTILGSNGYSLLINILKRSPRPLLLVYKGRISRLFRRFGYLVFYSNWFLQYKNVGLIWRRISENLKEDLLKTRAS